MKVISLVLILILVNYTNVFCQANDFPIDESCTCIMAGKNATTDGSVITSHTCDGRYRTWS